MASPRRPSALKGLRQAFDEARFGTQRTLNLRESLPTAGEAVTRAQNWLRQQQVEGAAEVLVITGRGNQSEDGISVVREAILRLLHVLRRRGVVTGHDEHTPGSFIVRPAPVSALWETPKRNGGRGAPPPPKTPPSLDELDDETRRLLRDLAERSLEGLGIQNTDSFVQSEMLRQFGSIAASIGTEPGREGRLRAAIRASLDQYE